MSFFFFETYPDNTVGAAGDAGYLKNDCILLSRNSDGWNVEAVLAPTNITDVIAFKAGTHVFVVQHMLGKIRTFDLVSGPEAEMEFNMSLDDSTPWVPFSTPQDTNGFFNYGGVAGYPKRYRFKRTDTSDEATVVYITRGANPFLL